MVPRPSDIATLAAARERVLATIADACARTGRDPATVELVAVSKTIPVERLIAAVDAGLTTLGENRVQEGETKAAAIDGATWHLVGPLQSNKARRALETFAMIHTVDSEGMAGRLDRIARETLPADRRYPVLVQVNVDRDPAKAGLSPDALEREIDAILAHDRIDVRGLMTVGQLVDDPLAARPTFVALRAVSESLRARHPGLGPELSMGMSHDFPIAIEEGATIVRVGRALFGERPHP